MNMQRVCVNFEQSLATGMGAEVAQYLSSGLATMTSMSLTVPKQGTAHPRLRG